jgi:hypothetical protein
VSRRYLPNRSKSVTATLTCTIPRLIRLHLSPCPLACMAWINFSCSSGFSNCEPRNPETLWWSCMHFCHGENHNCHKIITTDIKSQIQTPIPVPSVTSEVSDGTSFWRSFPVLILRAVWLRRIYRQSLHCACLFSLPGKYSNTGCCPFHESTTSLPHICSVCSKHSHFPSFSFHHFSVFLSATHIVTSNKNCGISLRNMTWRFNAKVWYNISI